MTIIDPSAGTAIPDDEWLERMLVADARSHRESYVDDDGFTSLVMTALPAPVAASPAWRKPVVTGMWAAAGIALASSLPSAVQDVAREAFLLLGAKPFALSEIAAAVAVLTLASYAAAAVALRRD